MGKTVEHDFYCLQCGKRAMSIQRPRAKMREKFHRKKLYCPHCRTTLNCIEVKNDTEVFEFREMFEAGEFKIEAEKSIEECVNYAIKC